VRSGPRARSSISGVLARSSTCNRCNLDRGVRSFTSVFGIAIRSRLVKLESALKSATFVLNRNRLRSLVRVARGEISATPTWAKRNPSRFVRPARGDRLPTKEREPDNDRNLVSFAKGFNDSIGVSSRCNVWSAASVESGVKSATRVFDASRRSSEWHSRSGSRRVTPVDEMSRFCSPERAESGKRSLILVFARNRDSRPLGLHVLGNQLPCELGHRGSL
jgi:hypothetical protein